MRALGACCGNVCGAGKWEVVCCVKQMENFVCDFLSHRAPTWYNQCKHNRLLRASDSACAEKEHDKLRVGR